MANKKNTFKYSVTWFLESKETINSSKFKKTTSEQLTGLDKPALIEWLKTTLDVAIKPCGEPYNPTLDSLTKSELAKYVSEDELKKMLKHYNKAYSTYTKILKTLDKIEIVESFPVSRNENIQIIRICDKESK